MTDVDESRVSDYYDDQQVYEEPPLAGGTPEPPQRFDEEDPVGEEPEAEPEVEDVAPTAVTGGLSKQTLKIIDFLRTEFEEKGRDETLSTEELFEGKTRKAVASTFFEILVLRTRGYLDVHQEEPYGNIELTAQETLFES
jgi:chromatin segregation and condensation protein Rec8/ScpA/Scc1 (kleisin family)